jgi:hypothetical protein
MDAASISASTCTQKPGVVGNTLAGGVAGKPPQMMAVLPEHKTGGFIPPTAAPSGLYPNLHDADPGALKDPRTGLELMADIQLAGLLQLKKRHRPHYLRGGTKMEYRLEIYQANGRDDQECLKIFTATAPFLPVRIGDLLNASPWDSDGSGWKLLRVLGVEHVISEKSGLGINPSGTIIHRALIYTEGVADKAETRPQAAL